MVHHRDFHARLPCGVSLPHEVLIRNPGGERIGRDQEQGHWHVWTVPINRGSHRPGILGFRPCSFWHQCGPAECAG
ncbi:hypothetical protein GCM10023198_24210 [Promicromonospora umidemergens]|uniref:Uncharacterized protein n=1 Tax=Promicromonospora umidemergens TaxID=629679 RepID=A0ABP8X8X4_9MICO